MHSLVVDIFLCLPPRPQTLQHRHNGESCFAGKKEEELPERLLGCIRLHHIDMEKVAAGPKHPIPVVEDGRSRGLTI